MHRTWMIAFAITLSAAVAAAQSLGDVARKEKERRKSVQKDGASEVITENDLASGRPPSDEDSGPRETDSTDDDGPRRPTIPDAFDPVGGGDTSGSSSSTDEWDEIYRQYQKRYSDAKAMLRFYEAFERHCEDGTPPPPLPPVAGGYWMINCDSFDEGVAQARKAMRDIEHACYDHARRLNVPPGRARLR